MRMLAAVVSTGLLFGCGADPSAEPVVDTSDGLIGNFSDALIAGNLDIKDAWLEGAIGEFEGIRHYATQVRAQGARHAATIMVIIDTGQRAAMAQLGGPSLLLGDVSVGMDVLTCQGPRMDDWQFDADLEDIQATVTENDRWVTIDYSGRVYDRTGMELDSDAYALATPQQRANIPFTVLNGSITFARLP